MKITRFLTLSGFLAACPLLAPSQNAPSPDSTKIQPGNYKLESVHARVLFSVSHFGFSTWYGEFVHPAGTATFDPKNPAADSVNITIPVANISTSNTKLDGELKEADWFDAAKYPNITYKSTKVTVTGPDTADVLGDLTLHGVTRPVTLSVKFNMGGVNMMSRAFTAGWDATARIHRMDFGVSKFAPAVGDEVDIIISAPFEKTS